jgi:hypothetical protein
MKNDMRYYVRSRGADDISGPFALDGLESQLKAGVLSPTHMVLADTGQTAAQLEKYWDLQWIPISDLDGLEGYTPSILRAPVGAAVPRGARTKSNEMMVVGGFMCICGILITAISATGALKVAGNGHFVVASGAIVSGTMLFLRGLCGR